jgi:hypothetical protein
MKDDKRLAGSRRLRQLLSWGMAPKALCGVPESMRGTQGGKRRGRSGKPEAGVSEGGISKVRKAEFRRPGGVEGRGQRAEGRGQTAETDVGQTLLAARRLRRSGRLWAGGPEAW